VCETHHIPRDEDAMQKSVRFTHPTAFPDAELVLSTREPALLRNRLARICITQMSAGSRTVPGGYEESPTDRPGGQQFPVSDHRSPAEVAAWLKEAEIEPVWEIPQPRGAC